MHIPQVVEGIHMSVFIKLVHHFKINEVSDRFSLSYTSVYRYRIRHLHISNTMPAVMTQCRVRWLCSEAVSYARMGVGAVLKFMCVMPAMEWSPHFFVILGIFSI